jgi:hypothetical protein
MPTFTASDVDPSESGAGVVMPAADRNEATVYVLPVGFPLASKSVITMDEVSMEDTVVAHALFAQVELREVSAAMAESMAAEKSVAKVSASMSFIALTTRVVADSGTVTLTVYV